jgi:hypothetical protein
MAVTRIIFFATAALAAIALLAATIAAAGAEPLTTFRNSQGQIVGYGERRGNTTIFTNPSGQQTGRAERQRDGMTIFYDANGQQVGTAKKR